MDPTYAIQTYEPILSLIAFMASWCAAMLTGLMFRTAL